MRSDLRKKKLLLFLYEKLPLWRRLFELERQLPPGKSVKSLLEESPFRRVASASKTAIGKGKRKPAGRQAKAGPREHHLGVTDETIRLWGNQDFVSERSSDTMALTHFVHVLKLMLPALPTPDLQGEAKDLAEAVSAYRDKLADESADLYDCGGCLGMGRFETQLVIDSIIHEEKPLLAFAYYPSKTWAEEHVKAFGGLYYLWLERETGLDRRRIWLQCGLQVRYTLDVAKQTIIRAKLHLPNLAAESPDAVASDEDGAVDPHWWHYDGFVRMHDPRAYWVFEKRDAFRQDFMYMVTGQSRDAIRSAHLMTGEYLTSGQDDAQSVVSGMAIFQRAKPYPRTETESALHSSLMKSIPCRLTPEHADFPRLQKILTALGR